MMSLTLNVISIGCQSSMSQSREGLSVDRSSHEFKPTDQNLQTSFQLRNTGKTALEIIRVDASCGCTAAEVKSTKLRPGEETTLIVSMRRPAAGNAESTVTIETIPAAKTPSSLRIIASAMNNQSRIAALQPASLRLDVEKCPERELRVVSIEEQSDGAPQLESSCDIPGLTFELVDKKSRSFPDKAFAQVERTYRIRSLAELSPGTHLGTITFTFGATTSDIATQKRLPVEIVAR